MSIQANLVNDTLDRVKAILELNEQLGTQVKVAVNQFVVLGGQAALEGYEWPEGFGEQDFLNVIGALEEVQEFTEQPEVAAPLVKMNLAW